MYLPLMITAIVVLSLLLFFVLLKYFLSTIKQNLEQQINKQFSNKQIILKSSNANFFGQTSQEFTQTRGMGALVLTKQELCFILAFPQNKLIIPISDITNVKITKSHLKKTIFRDLLYVEFLFQGQKDSVAWYIENPLKWKEAIENLNHFNL